MDERGNSTELRFRKGGLKELRVQPKLKLDGEEEEEEMEPLSPSARLFHQPHFNCYVIAMLGCATKIDVDVCKAAVANTLTRHPRFSSIQVIEEGQIGHWVRVDVNWDDHCVIPDFDPNMEDPDQFVEDYVSNLSKTTLDMSRPLWEFHVINLKTTEAEAVAIFRAHHSLGDGTSLISLLLASTRTTANPEALPTRPVSRRLIFQGRKGVALAWMFVRMLWNTMVDLLLFLATYLFYKDTETAFKGAEGTEFRPRRFVHRTLSLDDFKIVRSALNSTINDVMLGVTAAGLSRYLSRRNNGNMATEKNLGKLTLPPNIRVRGAVLVNIRPTPEIQDMAEMMEKKKLNKNWGNLLGYILLPFPMAILDDPLHYVRRAKSIADRKKLSFEALFTFASSAILVKTLGIKAAASLTHWILSNTTMSFSNIVGPNEEIIFWGHRMVYLAPAFYGLPHALTVNFISYMNKVKMVVAVDEEAVPDPHQLCDDLVYSLKLIKDGVLARK